MVPSVRTGKSEDISFVGSIASSNCLSSLPELLLGTEKSCSWEKVVLLETFFPCVGSNKKNKIPSGSETEYTKG